jgi:hypothetical protein
MNETNAWTKYADAWSAFVVGVLLLLTAWGNAVAMLVVSVVGLVIEIALLPQKSRRSATLVAIVACVMAFFAALALTLR